MGRVAACLAVAVAVAAAPAWAPRANGARTTGHDPAGDTQRVGHGTTLERIRQHRATGWMQAYVLRVDLTDPQAGGDALVPPALSSVEPLSVMARRAGAIAAVNGDFFNIGASGAPVGPVVTGGRLVKGPQRHRTRVAGVGEDGVGRISTVRLQGSVSLPSGAWRLADLNDANPGFPALLAPDGIGLFTPAWGRYSRAGAVRGQADVAEVTVARDRVTGVRRTVGRGAIPPDGYVLLGAGAGGRALARLHRGDRVAVRYGQLTSAPVPFRFAVGGKYVLVQRGAVASRLPPTAAAPRTAVGFADRGRTMLLVVTDGRRAAVPGLTLVELARLMRRLGARDALLLDDGGSSTLVARLPGHDTPEVVNHPSDGRERPIADGIGVFTTG